MTTQAKSILILLGTLIIGGVIGGAAVGMISQDRREKRDEIRGPGGFIRHMERIIDIRDSAQHAAVHPILAKADERNREILKSARHQMKAVFDTMLVELAPLLSAGQMESLRREQHNMKKKRKGPPNGMDGPPRGEEPPPPGE